MKKIIVICLLITVFAAAGALSSQYQIVDLYICEEGAVLAELSAKAIVSRKELYRASYCDCEGVNSSYSTEVRKGKWKRQGFEYEYGACEAPKNLVFHCICVGRDRY